jgi:dihydroxy-acid dehydratase
MVTDLRQNSRVQLDGPDRAPARSYLKAIGFTDEDLAKPIIGVAHEWIETMPCNFTQRALAARVKEGIRAAGGTPMELNTISISDGITMGTEGMKTSLISREVIADSIELVARGHMFDAIVIIVGCDKTIPAGAMALLRLDIPGLILYSGSIMPGHFEGRDVAVGDVFEAVGAYAAGKMTAEQLRELESTACPGAGACGGQYTANTMATAMEFLGLSPLNANSVPAVDPRKDEIGRRAGELVMDLLNRGVRPRQIVTPAACENAIASAAATGGSTNIVLHMLAIAKEAGLPLDIDDFDRVSERTPIIADLIPGGHYTAVEVDRAGGIGLIAQRLIEGGYVDGSQMTVTGRTLAEEASAVTETPGQQVIRPLSDPIKSTGGLVILKGNLAPEGCVVKVAGYERTFHRGAARVFDREEDAMAAVTARQIKPYG